MVTVLVAPAGSVGILFAGSGGFDQVKLIIQSGRDLVFWHPEDQSKRKIGWRLFFAVGSTCYQAEPAVKREAANFQKATAWPSDWQNGNWGGVVIL